MKKILILSIIAILYISLLLWNPNSQVLANNCTINMGNFYLFQTNLNNNRINLPLSYTYPPAMLINSQSLKNGEITGYMSADHTGCNDEFSRWAHARIFDNSKPAGKPPGCNDDYTDSQGYHVVGDDDRSHSCAYDNRWTNTSYQGSFPDSGNPVWVDFALGRSGYYQVEGSAYGYSFSDNSWSWHWKNLVFLYEKVTDLSIDPATRHLTGTVTVPWYTGVMQSSPVDPDPRFYLLINNDQTTLLNQSSHQDDIRIFPHTDAYRDWPDNTYDYSFNFQVDGLVTGQTYYWRIRQEGASYTTYIPGGSFSVAGLTTNPNTGLVPFTTSLTAFSGIPASQGPFDYYFWKSCNIPSTANNNLATMISICGNADTSFLARPSDSQVTSFTYSASGTYYPIALIVPTNGNPVLIDTSFTTQNPQIFSPFYPLTAVFRNKMWVLGGSFSQYLTFSSTDGISWPQNGNFPGIASSATSAVFNNQMWVIGGSDQSVLLDTVYSSSDGLNWALTSHLPNTNGVNYAVQNAAAVDFNSRLWLIGGTVISPAIGNSNIVYSSADGVSWTRQTDLPIILTKHAAVVFNEKIWLIGGYTSSSEHVLDRIYSSTDGNNWTLVGRLPRTLYLHSAVIFNNKIWVGGGFLSDTGIRNTHVYSSPDGVTWTLEGDLPPVFTQGGAQMLVHTDPTDNTAKLWVIGIHSLSDMRGQVFSSTNGSTWINVNTPCNTGNFSFILSPNPILSSQPTIGTVAGFSNCAGTYVYFSLQPRLGGISVGQTGSCISGDSGCAGQFFHQTPTIPGTYTYYAIVDKNINGVIDAGEMTSAQLVVGSGGGGGTPPAAQTSCGSGSARADGLVSTPALTGKFRTTGGCAIDSKTAFFPKLIKTFDDLESLYYTQDK